MTVWIKSLEAGWEKQWVSQNTPVNTVAPSEQRQIWHNHSNHSPRRKWWTETLGLQIGGLGKKVRKKKKKKSHATCILFCMWMCGKKLNPCFKNKNQTKKSCIVHSRHVTMQRVKLLVDVTVPRCVTEVMYKMLHPCPGVLWDRQRGRNNTEHKFIQSGNRKRKEKGKDREENREKKEKKKQWSKNKTQESKRVRSVEEDTKHIWHLLYLNYSNVYNAKHTFSQMITALFLQN